MVDSRPYRDLDGTTPNDYWKLSIPESGADAKRFLDSKKIAHKKSSTFDRLQTLHAHVQRGLLV